MSKVKLGISKLNALELISKTQTVIGELTGNVYFPTTNPTVAELQTSVDELQAAVQVANLGAHYAIDVRNAKYVVLSDQLRSLAAYIQSISKGDALIIESTGFEIVQRGEPIGPLPAVADLSATVEENMTGYIFLNWKSTSRGVRNYTVKMTTGDPIDPASVWTQIGLPSKTKFAATGLTPGVVYSFVVTPNGAAGMGTPSFAISLRAI